MGVNGLWTVIQPCARPTNLATLNRKRLAVDASIWIYQFLKAVRDKEGNALRNSHVVGFFRRICKLLWFGIRPVFVFDGGAPALKRQTITNRKRRREGRRDDAARTAGKLLAVQMLRNEKAEFQEPVEEIPDLENLVYVDELGMSQQERQRTRKFHKQDAYHLPELDGGIEGMGRPEDPRIMSIEELEEYARQFHSGEDINLYDFSKIDFEGEFFKSLPPADRYNILNAARLRSRLRMGLSKEQLDGMFPDRMAFSRFQIERVRERNHLTQRLMQEAGMTGTDLTLGINARIAGEKDREYILVKNEGAEGGWALGVVSREKDVGEIHKPIDVDALDFQYQAKDEDADWEEDDFEDVPIEGLNRLPRIHDAAKTRRTLDNAIAVDNEEDSLFVEDDFSTNNVANVRISEETLFQDEEEDLNRAIALSLKNQHGLASPAQKRVEEEEEEEEEEEGGGGGDEEFEDVPAPKWTQKAVAQPNPVASTSGSIIAHIVNKRANAAVPKRRESNASSNSEVDLRSAVSAARKKKVVVDKPKPQPTSTTSTIGQNPFDGPLPFEKLDWKSSIFGERRGNTQSSREYTDNRLDVDEEEDEDLAGGFLQDVEDDDKPRPLPPWMMEDSLDIRDSMKAQQQYENETNQADLKAAMEEEKRRQKDAVIEIESSDSGSDDDVEIIDAPLRRKSPMEADEANNFLRSSRASPSRVDSQISVTRTENARQTNSFQAHVDIEEQGDRKESSKITMPSSQLASQSASPEPDFKEVEIAEPPEEPQNKPNNRHMTMSLEPKDIPVVGLEIRIQQPSNEIVVEDTSSLVLDQDEFDDEFSDPEEAELLAQMAEEAEEHARFASQLNNKSEKENQEAYERELKALRTQQKKDRRDADEVTQIMVTECQALLRYFGIPYIAAPMEAEAQCAELVNLGLVDGIVTDDSDIFLFGGTRVYKNMFNSNKFVECYLSSDLEKELSLSREQLISIAQLLGSDYTEGLPGVGPVTAIEILSEFPGSDGLKRFHDWWQEVQVHNRPKEADNASSFRKKFRKSQATKLFLPAGFPSPAVSDAYLHPEVDHSTEPFQWGSPDVEGLRQFLMATIGWSQERTDEVLVPVIRDMNRREVEGTQSNITRYFEGGVGVGVKEAFAPKQRVQSSKRMTQAVNKLRANAATNQGGSDGAVENESPVSRSDGRKRKARKATAIGDNNHGQDGEYETIGTQSSSKRKRKGKSKAND
ncbi:hypothetical protein GQX73_g4553 [Xylaria multiplex]|uniref:Uncharacterized protein n=1 Tax=Xylaria multiplex TaxID=323545 RepID=A0A7C8IPL0_9PEZI|nr:hypothetical protein GQX73_g4553 [Xylaria multiplex]